MRAMNYLPLPLIAFIAGVAIATQANMNAQLGVILKNPLLATVVAFFSSLIFTSLMLLLFMKKMPAYEVIKTVPLYLWFSGGLLSATGIALFYWLIPKLGAGPMMSYALTGQLLLAMLASHFGWFTMPVIPISWTKAAGICSMIAGLVLINLH
jgi:bacterial/archaeal transporter family-2 protein